MTNIEKIRQEIERRKKENMYDELPITIGRYYEDRDLLAFIDSLPEEKPSEDLEEENRKTRDAEVILNGHGLLVDVTKWADGYKLKVIIKEN